MIRRTLLVELEATPMSRQDSNSALKEVARVFAATLANVQSETRAFARVAGQCMHLASMQTSCRVRASLTLENRAIRRHQTCCNRILSRSTGQAVHCRSRTALASAQSRRAARAWPRHRRCAHRSRTRSCARRRGMMRRRGRREALLAQTYYTRADIRAIDFGGCLLAICTRCRQTDDGSEFVFSAAAAPAAAHASRRSRAPLEVTARD